MTTRRNFVVQLVAAAVGFAPGAQGGSLTTAAVDRTTLAAGPLRRRIGLNVHTVDATAISLLTLLGVTQVRIAIQWNIWVDPRADYKRNYLAAIDALRAAGLDVTVVVHSPQDESIGLPAGTVAMCEVMSDMARRRQALTWQVMNEMDGEPSFCRWFGAGDPAVTQAERGARYGQLLGPVYDAIKRTDSTARVITGGIALDPVPFYDGMVSRAAGKFDAVCVHAYGAPVLNQFKSKSVALRNVIGNVPLWCTETGNNSTDDAAQATDLGMALDDNDLNRRFDRCYVYALITDEAHGDHYGICHPDGTRRSAASLLLDRSGS